jgi:hypothetical protein
MAEIVAVALADTEVDNETDPRSTNVHTAKSTIISPKHGETACSSLAIQIPSATMRAHGSTAVSQDTSNPTASTSNVPGINATKSKRALHHSPQREIVT